MQRFIVLAGILSLLVTLSAQSASAGWLRSRGNVNSRRPAYTRTTMSKTVLTTPGRSISSTEEWVGRCDNRSNFCRPWYVDRVDPLLEAQAWYSF